MNRFLNGVERAGNRLPDPAMLFIYGLGLIFMLSAVLALFNIEATHPVNQTTLTVRNLLDPHYIIDFLSSMISTFMNFPPLGTVLVAMLGIGIAEKSGFIDTAIKQILSVAPRKTLTPILITIGIFSHIAADAGYVLVIPIGGIIFYAAGRHPLAGITAAFAGVSGGFSATLIPSALDPLLAGLTQSAAQLYDPTYTVNPLCNFFFTSASSLLVILSGWYITDCIIEPRLRKQSLNKNIENQTDMHRISDTEKRAFKAASLAMILGVILLFFSAFPENSGFRDENGSLNSIASPLMKSMIPLIFLLFLLPGIIYGKLTKRFSDSKKIIQAFSSTLSDMSHYIAMAFFIALFLKAFNDSHLGILLAITGAEALQTLQLPSQLTIIGIVLFSAVLNLLIGSASAKWALLSIIFVPMLMGVGISPELTQTAYRIGDSSSNIITPMLPYFPLIIVYCQRYVKDVGIGTVASLMMPYTLFFLVAWTIFLLIYWSLGIPLGLQGGYVYPMT
ncbi:p-aminobenzoyl-glutamate transport protein [invertebrate metagenome]|uniref:p-aminobenzoyl-glutamate transport protein n=1 Tax=invertebrate metagenome TaxID=1711999 RepID=A0A2H9T6A6_9ZZZZ